jgi:hypothetical protein
LAKKALAYKVEHHPDAKLVTADCTKLNTLITRIGKAVTAIVRDISVAAASSVVHALVHGDVAPARNLINAMGGRAESAFRTNALITYFEAFGPFVWDKEEKQLVYSKERAKVLKVEYTKDKMAFASKLMAEPYYKFSKQAEYQGFNLMSEIKRVIKKAHTAREKHSDSDLVNLTGLEEIERTFTQLAVNA